MDEGVRYTRRVVEALWNGGFVDLDERGWIETPHWMELRAYAERTGDLESEALVSAIDLERALTALQSRHPVGAVVVACTALLDMDAVALHQALGGRTNWARMHNKSVAWCAAWLSGLPVDDPDPDAPSCERAWRKAR